jgi:hypothetical protein
MRRDRRRDRSGVLRRVLERSVRTMKTLIAALIAARRVTAESGIVHSAYEALDLAPCEERYCVAPAGSLASSRLRAVDDSASSSSASRWNRYCERVYAARQGVQSLRVRNAA